MGGNTCGQIVINVLVEFEFHLVNIKVGVFFKSKVQLNENQMTTVQDHDF